MVVTAVPVPEVGTAPSAPPPRRTDDRVDNFTDLAARLQLDASVVRRALVSREELLPVFGEMSFADSTPEPGEMDGTDASNFAHTETLPFPVLYRGAVTEAVALPEPPGPWHGRRVSIRKLLPDVADRQKVADFLNKSHAIAQEMWRYCVKLRTDPAAKPPRKVTAEPTVIPASAIPARYRDWQWDCWQPLHQCWLA